MGCQMTTSISNLALLPLDPLSKGTMPSYLRGCLPMYGFNQEDGPYRDHLNSTCTSAEFKIY
ncbi:hypothetical protein C4D60_Mb05t03250 [Musa balbisiana]|uniref:Uncharacterized protein n=1 Tax=Musa balbisiana TaxID=52838 RepID=A0A4S8JTC2_MUSBA|nr:hypothetical protein C4D60_Mb05t03250 [Musa balbisiana]